MEGVGNNFGELGNKADGLTKHVLGANIIGIIVGSVERQHRSGQHVHDVLTAKRQDDILGEVLG